MTKRRVFVSCGQETEEELQLGIEIKTLIEKHDMEGFLAQTVHSADELNTTVFEAIQSCDGFCAVLHKRGEIKYLEYPPIQRSSVWIQQEIALLMYRRFYQRRSIPIRVFSQKRILLEGLMKYTIANPIEFANGEEVLEGVSTWLQGPEFHVNPLMTRRENLFQNRTRFLNDDAWLLLELITVHTESPTEGGDFHEIRKDFFEILRERGEDDKAMNNAFFIPCRDQLSNAGLLKQMTREGRTWLVISKNWSNLISDALSSRGQII